MPYQFQAALYCDPCGKAICTRLTDQGKEPADLENQGTWDSDDYPKHVPQVGESDSVDHCDCGPDCLSPEVLPDGTKIGAWLENDLTADGVAWLNDQITDPANYHSAVVRFWHGLYEDLEPLPADLVDNGAHFDRFDICEAYAVLEWDWNSGGWLRERPSNQRRHESTDVQLSRMQFRPRPSLSYRTLEENGKAIYWQAANRFGLVRHHAK